jgi:addiction module HigA family antidote
MPKSLKDTSAGTTAKNSIHPGQYVRDKLLTPKNVTVSAAAKLVGVGRPALSNFLNGHVAATPEMAARIEVAFGLPAQDLVNMQTAYEAAQSKANGAPANATPYVVPFLGIQAAAIEKWVERNIPARIRLAVLLRTLVISTGTGITKIDFPANDDAERAGWDGYLETTQATPWIPEGVSGWEFGTNQDIKGKADGDYDKSVKALSKAERGKTTFVFVTPRHWAGKAKWLKEKQGRDGWKEVRAHDSSDLEQWLAQSIAGQVWLHNEIGEKSDGARSLDRCWSDWADVTDPPLAGSLFTSAIGDAKRKLLARLTSKPEKPIVIAADSTEEGLAFLAQAFGPAGGEELMAYRERILAFDQTGTLPKLLQGEKSFIAVATNRDVERELGPVAATMHTFAVYPRNAATVEPDIKLEPLNYEAFNTSLAEMGCERHLISRLGEESGRSLTVLRRRLALSPAIKTPRWAEEHQTAASLVPFFFAGSWNSINTADQTVLELLGDQNYEKLEKACQRLAGLNDPPIWSVGTYRGAISKIDLLFAVAQAVTKNDFDNYFSVAKIVLGEDDPKLDLPENDRWTAAVYGKTRQLSGTLRAGVCETLVLLAAHGNRLFNARIGFDCEYAVRSLVRELLTPLTTRTLEANERDLSAYAEAAPEEFLSILQEDLKTEKPACYGLMRPAGTGVFGNGCPRTGLLWALEGLAWNPETLPRTALILAQLAEIEINDNWANKPISSLEAIFRNWMPQTAADHETRLRVIKLLADKFPNVAWKICIDQIEIGHRSGGYNHKPRWRNDAYGFGEPFTTWAPINAFIKEMVDMALNWDGGYTRKMLCELILKIHAFSPDHQADVWQLVENWAKAGASDADKAFLREKIRTTVLSRRGRKRTKEENRAVISAAAKKASAALEPTDLLQKHLWLFREHWVEDSADELYSEPTDFQKREERVTQLRTDALREIVSVRGLEGILQLAEMGKAAGPIGWILQKDILKPAEITDLLCSALQSSSNKLSWAMQGLISGLLQDLNTRPALLVELKAQLTEADFVRLLLLAPFRRSTWQLVDALDGQHQEKYWNEISPHWIFDEDGENNEGVARLLKADRPRAAFAAVHFKLDAIELELLFRVMTAMAQESKDQEGQYQLEGYYVDEAFKLLDKSPTLTLEQKAGLEFSYIDALSRSWGQNEGFGVPNLEKYVEKNPELFVQAVVWAFKRRGEGEDPPEWKAPEEQLQLRARRGSSLLEALSRVPAHDYLGVMSAENLAKWIKTVRDACAELGRLDIADICIGKLLSSAPADDDGIWPCQLVAQVMEDVHSVKMMAGAHTGLYNSRGTILRGEGGEQERELAEKYRHWANAHRESHPFLSSELLMGMVRTYEHQASREDTEADIRKRLGR